ncbi:MAG: transposase [Marmoricola sp.]|nr:transposase [Marmoricola sp.]
MRLSAANTANQLWLSDITEHWTGEGKLYLCAIKDVYSNQIVGYSIDSRMKSRLAVAALNNAVARRFADGDDVAGCVLHPDRGSQFRSRKFVHALNRHEWWGRWAGSAPPATTQPWSRSFRCCRRRPGPTHLDNPRGTADRDRHLDREDLPPTPSSVRTRPVDPGRIRADHDTNRHPGGLTEIVTVRAADPCDECPDAVDGQYL